MPNYAKEQRFTPKLGPGGPPLFHLSAPDSLTGPPDSQNDKNLVGRKICAGFSAQETW
jgi:hypothetical protein